MILRLRNYYMPSMAKSEATAKGFDDAWMLRQGYITEGSSNNAWIIKR